MQEDPLMMRSNASLLENAEPARMSRCDHISLTAMILFYMIAAIAAMLGSFWRAFYWFDVKSNPIAEREEFGPIGLAYFICGVVFMHGIRFLYLSLLRHLAR